MAHTNRTVIRAPSTEELMRRIQELETKLGIQEPKRAEKPNREFELIDGGLEESESVIYQYYTERSDAAEWVPFLGAETSRFVNFEPHLFYYRKCLRKAPSPSAVRWLFDALFSEIEVIEGQLRNLGEVPNRAYHPVLMEGREISSSVREWDEEDRYLPW